MPSILFIAAHRINRSPSQRYRFEQYFSFLEANGYKCNLSPIISERGDKFFYQQGNYLKKAGIFLNALQIRIGNLLKFNDYDIIFVQREAIMIGSPFFEKSIKKTKAKFVFDFDDSIWLMDTSTANKKFEWLKNPEKTSINISYADMVFAGNKYLANYASQYNSNVKIIPTTIDTEFHKPLPKDHYSNKITIGWSGSTTTIKHFEYALPILREIKLKFGDKVSFKVMGDENYINEELNIRGLKWEAEKEVEILNSFDIGIMPLPNDEWAKGKCGLKGLSYMSLEIPTIMSPVGVNEEIIEHGVNGFLADSKEDWILFISQLIDSPELRVKIGQAARRTVLEKYSVDSQKNTYLNLFNELISKN